MLEKLLALIERIADALEVIAAAKSGNDAPRTPATTTQADKDNAKALAEADAKDKAAKAAKDKAAKDKAAKDKAAKDKAAASDPLGGDDPLAGEDKREYTEKEVRAKLSELIDKEGRDAAFAVLKERGNGAKAFTDLKKEYYEDVYVECEERLG